LPQELEAVLLADIMRLTSLTLTALTFSSRAASRESTDLSVGDAEQVGERRLVEAESGREAGEAVAQHMERDGSRQITQLGDPQLYLPISGDHLIGSAGKHHVAVLWLGADAQAASDKGRSDAPVLVSASRAVLSRQIDFRPAQAEHLATAPVGHDRQPRGDDGRLPDSVARASSMWWPHGGCAGWDDR
jgi:hypothetical protein